MLFRSRQALLPATARSCGDGNPPSPLRQDRHANLLVVRQRRASVQAPPFHGVPSMATADEEAMERDRRGFEVEEAASPVGEVSVGGEGHGRRLRVLTHHESGVQRYWESAPRGQGGGGERRGGGPRPALECTFSLVFSFRRLCRGDFFFLLSFLTVGGVGGPL